MFNIKIKEKKWLLTLFDWPFRRTFNIRNLRNSIFAFESANICCASANNFLSRPWWLPLIDCIIFSAPFFTFISMFNCFSNDVNSLSFGVSSLRSSVSENNFFWTKEKENQINLIMITIFAAQINNIFQLN